MFVCAHMCEWGEIFTYFSIVDCLGFSNNFSHTHEWDLAHVCSKNVVKFLFSNDISWQVVSYECSTMLCMSLKSSVICS